MAGETIITVVGNLVADPTLKFTNSGVPFASFTIASTPRTFDRQANEWRDGEALFLRATVWREQAQNVAQSLSKGMRVIARGDLQQRNYETKEGEKRSAYELAVHEIGPALRYATASVSRNAPGGAQGGGFGATSGVGMTDWAQPAQNAHQNGFGGGFTDEESQPF